MNKNITLRSRAYWYIGTYALFLFVFAFTSETNRLYQEAQVFVYVFPAGAIIDVLFRIFFKGERF